MQLKHTFVALAAAGLLSTQAYASEAQIDAAIQPAQPVAAFTDADMQALFGQDAHKPMQLAALSGQEMKETEGAVLPFLGLGAALYGHFTARTLAAYAVSRFSTVYATFEAAKWWRGRRG